MSVHDAADAQGVSHTLIHAVFKGDFHIRGESLQHTDTHTVDNVFGILKSLAAVESGMDFDRKTIFFNVTLAKLGDHSQIVRINIRECDLNIVKFRDG